MRDKVFGTASTRKITVMLTEELVDVLREVATKHALAPSDYVRSLLVTHLNKLKAARDNDND